jgi:hypothetical protein
MTRSSRRQPKHLTIAERAVAVAHWLFAGYTDEELLMAPPPEPQKIAFAERFLQCWDYKEAAIAVGYSARTARRWGKEMLTHPRVLGYIWRRLRELQMETDEILVRITEQARGIYGNYINPDGTFNLEQFTADGKGHLIKKITMSRGVVSSIEFYDAQTALTLMARYHGLLVDRSEVETHIQVEEAEDARSRLEDLIARRARAAAPGGEDVDSE